MRIDLPEPKLPVRVGPPAPPAPTFATFSRDVRVLRGKVGQPPDQLDSDSLRLTLLPTAKPAASAASASAGPETAPVEPVAATGPMTELALREAIASGHAVWLRSEAQGITTRCNELIYNKLLPERPDQTYLRGDATTKLQVEKLEYVAEGPEKGQVESVTTIRSIDATIFDDGRTEGPGTIVSRGPGLLETRPARDKPVERTAYWEDQIEMRDEVGPDKNAQKRITLTGNPKFVDTTEQATLEGRRTSSRIVVTLRPKPKPETATQLASAATPKAARAVPSLRRRPPGRSRSIGCWRWTTSS